MKKKKNDIYLYTDRPGTEEDLGSTFFDRLAERAEEYLKNPAKAAAVLKNAFRKSIDLDDNETLSELKKGVQTLGRMMNAMLAGDYKRLPTQSLVRIMAGILYFLFFVDLVPDFIPLLGLLDDAMVIAWVIKGLRQELDDFVIWEGR